MPLTDLLPVLKRDRGVVVGQLDPYGLYPVLRFNQLQGPDHEPGRAPGDHWPPSTRAR